MTVAVFVDTNVFVYSRQTLDPRKQALASEWLERLWIERAGRTSMQVLCECFATLTRKLDPPFANDEAWDYVRSLLAWEPQPIAADAFARAFEIQQRHRLNWWDCLIVAAAQLQGCSVLLTEDLQDQAVFGSLTVRSPFTLGVSEGIASYAVREPQVPAHRPRGRPRKVRSGSIAAAG
ncbi:MAG: PIN domain-containing protein [Gammaproteobacteria bacterium]